MGGQKGCSRRDAGVAGATNRRGRLDPALELEDPTKSLKKVRVSGEGGGDDGAWSALELQNFLRGVKRKSIGENLIFAALVSRA